ncbi:hypothetical protein WG66_004358 [Moniliophthora roreri]|nr:hypothetical protein WG66_004358 [Moniliophthora roreri]
MSNLPPSPSDAAEPRTPKANSVYRSDSASHVRAKAWLLEILTAPAENTKGSQGALTLLACEVFCVAAAIKGESNSVTEERRSLRRIMDRILELTKSKADENQFTVMIQVHRRELQLIKSGLSMDRLEKVIDRLEKVMDRLEQLPVLQQRTKSAPNCPRSPSPMFTLSSTPWSLTPQDSTSQSFPPPAMTRKDNVGSTGPSRNPFVRPAEPPFSVVSPRFQEAQPIVYYNTYNSCVLGGTHTHNHYGSQEGSP